MFTVLQFIKTQSEMTIGFSFRFRRVFNLDYFELICLFCCLSGLLDFCVSVICVCMAIIQNFARCHLLQFRWLLLLSQCLQRYVAGSALNDMFRNSRLKQPCHSLVTLVAQRAWLVRTGRPASAVITFIFVAKVLRPITCFEYQGANVGVDNKGL